MTLMEKIVVGTLTLFTIIILKVCIGIMLEPIEVYNDTEESISYSEDENNTDANIKKVRKNPRVIKVTATMYNPVKEQCDNTPLITAGNYKINYWRASKHRWIAVSRDLLKYWGGHLKWGDKVRITGAGHKNGIYTVVDTMNPRFTKRIDFLETTGTKWYKFKNVRMEKV